MKPLLLLILVCLGAIPLYSQSKNDTFSVYFDLDIPTLDSKGQRFIDQLYADKKINRKAPIAIVGYADFIASEDYNLLLSQKRADFVKNYLSKFDLNLNEIRTVVGRGEVKRKDTTDKPQGVAKDRRVDIVMEYEKVYKRKLISDRGDMTVVMRPKELTEVPPSTNDPGFEIENIPVGKSYILKNIYFPMGRHFPKQASDEDLQTLLTAMKENPMMEISVEGHVCCISNVEDAFDLDSRQMDLSENRARFIFEYLKARGIDASRIRYKGFGKSRPIYVNEETPEQASINRRVEVRIIKK